MMQLQLNRAELSLLLKAIAALPTSKQTQNLLVKLKETQIRTTLPHTPKLNRDSDDPDIIWA